MEFENLTPFSTLNYIGYDTDDQEYEVVTMCVEYKLLPSDKKSYIKEQLKHIHTVYVAEFDEDNPIELCMADEFYEEPNTSSILQESDIIPFKPKCDVLVQGHAYANKSCKSFEAGIALYRQDNESANATLTQILNKNIWITGSRQWQRKKKLHSIKSNQFTQEYMLSDIVPTQKVPLRYEFAVGGSCEVINPQRSDKDSSVEHYHEVCYRNPIGRGWFEKSYFSKLQEFSYELPEFIPAPQIVPAGSIYKSPVITEQKGAMTAKDMAKLNYSNAAAGLSALHRSWAPRLAKAGTYDEEWLENRHPRLPKDFDFSYWNCALEDQQIDYPDLTKPHTLLVKNLIKGGGYHAILLPRHRAFVLTDSGFEYHAHPMNLDTLIFNTDSLSLKLVWRLFIPTFEGLNKLEARFLTDPDAPFITYEDPESIRARAREIWEKKYAK